MKQKETLTNEKLKGLFQNNFDLANFTINLAKQDVQAGREITLDGLLEEVMRNPHGHEIG